MLIASLAFSETAPHAKDVNRHYLQPPVSDTASANTMDIAVMVDKSIIGSSKIVEEKMNVCLNISTISEKQRYQWRVKGLVPQSDSLYSDTDEPTLRLQSDIDMDGSQYFCEIAHFDNQQDLNQKLYFSKPTSVSTSSVVTLKVSCPLDKFKEVLGPIYLAQPEVPEDSWPPVSSRTYINLALVKQQKINYGGEYARFTIRGDMDDILNYKEKIEYKNIFDGLRSGSLFLIEGRPGSGKTTLVHKITRDWASSEVHGPMRLVLLVSLRVLNNWNKPATLEDILRLFDFQENQQIIKDRKGKGVCFIFDGLDEFSPPDKKNSIVHKIINKTYLPQAMVVVASRPAALVKLTQRADKVVEVIGFPKDQIFQYVENYPFSNSSKVGQLNDYLLSHPNVLHMCYLPIHASMVAFLFEVIGKVPRTETEMYEHFTRFTLMRSISKHEEDELEDMDTDDMSGEERQLFNTICEIALNKTLLNKQVLDQDEIKLRLKCSDSSKDSSLGLVTIDRTAGLYGFKNIYTFLHLTYQEYLAAHHISILNDEDQHKLIKQYKDTDHMQVVWKFYCGLVKFEGNEYKIKDLFNKSYEKVGLNDIQCAYESQQKVVAECILKEMSSQIHLEEKYLTTADFTALGYLLANGLEPILLCMVNCTINTEAFDALLKEIREESLSLRSLCYESNEIDLEGVKKLLNQCHGNCLQELQLIASAKINESSQDPLRYQVHSSLIADGRFSPGSSSDDDIEDIQTSGKYLRAHSPPPDEFLYTVPHTLDFYGFPDSTFTKIRDIVLTNVHVGPKTLSTILEFCGTLKSLTLCNGIEEEAIETLLAGLSKCKELEKVICSTFSSNLGKIYIDITSTDTHAKVPLPENEYTSVIFVHGIRDRFFQTLTLNVSGCTFLPLTLVAHCSKYWPKPKVLGLLQNPGLDTDIIPFIVKKCAVDFSALEKLILGCVKVDYGAVCLANKLFDCTELRELKIDNKYFITGTHQGISFIVSSLAECSNLERLILNGLPIEVSGARFLSGCLKKCWPKLQELSLRDCNITEEGAVTITHNLDKCTDLAKLDLSLNNVSDEGAQKIKSRLQSHKLLTELTL